MTEAHVFTTVRLELTKEEAEVLHCILGRIGGPHDGVRRYAQDIRAALSGVHVNSDYLEKEVDDSRDNNSIYFK